MLCNQENRAELKGLVMFGRMVVKAKVFVDRPEWASSGRRGRSWQGYQLSQLA